MLKFDCKMQTESRCTLKEELVLINACMGGTYKYGNMSHTQALNTITEAHWLAWYLIMTGYDLTKVIPEFMENLDRMTLRQQATRVCNRVSQIERQDEILNTLKKVIQ